jgi:hypothetical protein
MQKQAVGTLCGLVQKVIDAGCNQGPSMSHIDIRGMGL